LQPPIPRLCLATRRIGRYWCVADLAVSEGGTRSSRPLRPTIRPPLLCPPTRPPSGRFSNARLQRDRHRAERNCAVGTPRCCARLRSIHVRDRSSRWSTIAGPAGIFPTHTATVAVRTDRFLATTAVARIRQLGDCAHRFSSRYRRLAQALPAERASTSRLACFVFRPPGS
jgi:hypothetical protein